MDEQLKRQQQETLAALCGNDKTLRKSAHEAYSHRPELHTQESQSIFAKLDELKTMIETLMLDWHWLEDVWIDASLCANLSRDVKLSNQKLMKLPIRFGNN